VVLVVLDELVLLLILLLLHCSCCIATATAALLLHCCCTAAALLLHCCCTAAALLQPLTPVALSSHSLSVRQRVGRHRGSRLRPQVLYPPLSHTHPLPPTLTTPTPSSPPHHRVLGRAIKRDLAVGVFLAAADVSMMAAYPLEVVITFGVRSARSGTVQSARSNTQKEHKQTKNTQKVHHFDSTPSRSSPSRSSRNLNRSSPHALALLTAPHPPAPLALCRHSR
jgi:hypothetical protein